MHPTIIPIPSPFDSHKVLSIETNDVDNFKALSKRWADKVDFWTEVVAPNEPIRVMIHRDQQSEFEAFLRETGFTSQVVIENVEVYVFIAIYEALSNRKRADAKNNKQLGISGFSRGNEKRIIADGRCAMDRLGRGP